MRTWIVVPTYNEAENLERVVLSLLELRLPEIPTTSGGPGPEERHAATDPPAPTGSAGNGTVHANFGPPAAETVLPHRATNPAVSVLIVDDASPDGTGEIADRLSQAAPHCVHVLHRTGKLGLGSAYVEGFGHALNHGAEVVVQMDADFSHSPRYLASMVEMLRDHDVVVGSRWAPGGQLDQRWEYWRYLLSKFANLYARRVTGLRVYDATAGFKAFRASALRRLPLDRIRSEGFAFQVEIAAACQRLDLRVAELPIYFEERELGRSKMSLRIILEAMWRVWQIRINP